MFSAYNKTNMSYFFLINAYIYFFTQNDMRFYQNLKQNIPIIFQIDFTENDF